ncbi:MAG: ABC transporter permease [Candidatus Saccharimonadales bacterium]
MIKAKDKNQGTRSYASIKTTVLIHIVLRNLIDKRLRSFLTIFGVVIGVGSVFFLLSFGLGLQDLVTKQVIGDKSLNAIDVSSPNSKIIKLNDDALNKIKRYPHVEKAGVQYSFPGIMKFNGGEIDVVSYGLDVKYQDLSTLTLSKGRMLDDRDSDTVLISQAALKSVGIEDVDSAIGQIVKIIIPFDNVDSAINSVSKDLKIVGIIDSGAGSEVFMPIGLFSGAQIPIYSNLKVVVDDVANINTVRKQIESGGFQTASLIDTMDEIESVFRFLNLILIGFGSIGMIIAILGMFNTLTISLIERTKEIGLMMSLGARRSDMRRLFIIDAGIISFVGAVSGVIIAVLAGRIVNLYINIGASQRGVNQSFDVFAVPIWAVMAIIGITVLVGLLVVYFPSKRAEHINPIDALRRE